MAWGGGQHKPPTVIRTRSPSSCETAKGGNEHKEDAVLLIEAFEKEELFDESDV